MASKCCVVIACSNDDRSEDIEFFPFPRGNRRFTRLMRQIWTRCTGRADYWSPREDDRCFICSDHFVYGRPSLADPFPTRRLPVKLSYILEIVDRMDMPRERVFQSHANIQWQLKKSGTAKGQSPSFIPLPSVGEVFSLDHSSNQFGRPKSDNAAVPVNSGKVVVAALDTIVHVGINNIATREEDMLLDGESYSIVVTSGFTNCNVQSSSAGAQDCFKTEYLRQETSTNAKKSSNPEEVENYEECNATHAATTLAVQQQIYTTEHTYCTCQPELLQNAVTAKTSIADNTPDEGEVEIVPHDKEQPETIEVPSDNELEIFIPPNKESTSTSPTFEELVPLKIFKKSKTAQFKKNRNYRTSLYCNCYKSRHLSTVSRIKLRRVKKMLGYVGDSKNCSMCPDKFSSLCENAMHICRCHLNCQVLCLRCLQYIPAGENGQKHKCRLKFFGFKQMHVLTEKVALDKYYPFSTDLCDFRNSIAPRPKVCTPINTTEKRENFPLSLNRWRCNRCSEYILNDDKELLISHIASSHHSRCAVRKNMGRFCKICNQSFVGVLSGHLTASHLDDVYDLPIKNAIRDHYSPIESSLGKNMQKSVTHASKLNRTKNEKNTPVIEKSPATRHITVDRRSDFLATNFNLHKRDSIPISTVSKPVNSDFSYWKRRSRHLLSSNRPSMVKQRQPCGRFHCPTSHCLLCNMGPKKYQTYKKKVAAQKKKKSSHVDSTEMKPTTSNSGAIFGNIWDEFKSKILSRCDDDYSAIDSKSKSSAHETVTLD